MGHRLPASVVFSAAIIFLDACGTTGPVAPEITPAVVSAGARQKMDAAALARGRADFVRRCAGCHALPALTAHSADEWPSLVSRMAKRAGLNETQGREVLAYVLAARQ